jgi:hypothetical protein
MNWIPEPAVNEHASSRSSVTRSQGDRTLFSKPDGTVDTDLTEGAAPHNKPELADSDSDGEFEFEVTRRLLDKSKKSFKLTNYAEAVDFLQKGVASSNRLPNSRRTQAKPSRGTYDHSKLQISLQRARPSRRRSSYTCPTGIYQ